MREPQLWGNPRNPEAGRGQAQEVANEHEEATASSQGAGREQTEEPTPFGRSGPELPGDCARYEGDPGAGA